jgi:hypothetical protein
MHCAEREAGTAFLVSALSSSHQWPIGNSDDFLLSKSPFCDDIDEEECASVSIDHRVFFADDLVTEVYTRPCTEESEISNLYYSTEETQR